MKSFVALGLAATALSASAPALAVIPIYPNPGIQNPANFSFFAGNTGYLRTWFAGKGGAAYTVHLGAIVNGVDRGLGINNQTYALGQLHNFGAINAGDTIKFYINVENTGQTYTNLIADNPDGVQHFYASFNYTGGDFGIPVSAARPGTYFGTEDLPGGGDFNYTDLQFIARTGAIPEPANWAIMILGFAAIGGALRFRRGKSSLSFG